MALESALAAAAAALRGATSVIIGSHVEPDGDAVGSTLGLASALTLAGIDAGVVLASGSGCPSTYAFLPGSDRYRDPDDFEAPDVFVSLDSPALHRLGRAEPLARSARTLIAIDHHPDASADGHINVLDPEAAATGCLVWRLLPHLGVTADRATADCLYAALLTDTGRFSYGNTTPHTLRTAADLVDAGAHPHEIYAAIYETRSPGAQLLLGRTLERIALANGGQIAYAWIDGNDFTETGARPEEAENLIEYVRALGGVRAVFLAKVNGGTVRVSLRAKDETDVGAIARGFGGGGHRAAAGFTWEGTLTGLLETLLPALPGGAR